MHTTYEVEAVESAISIRRIFVAIELSKSSWVVAIQPPAVDKVSLFRITGGDIEKLFALLDQAKTAAVGRIRSVPAMRLATTAFGSIAR
jgi:hypothetical protein